MPVKTRVYLINEYIEVCIIQVNGWIVFQQCHQEPLYLSTLNVTSIVQVVYAKSNCIPKQTSLGA